jgi:glycerol uptake facilitator-like aquaporin
VGRKRLSGERDTSLCDSPGTRSHCRIWDPLFDSERQGGIWSRAGFASNGFADHSPGKYGPLEAFIVEVVLTFFFLIVILGATHGELQRDLLHCASACLTLIHLISIPVTNTSVNPARSTGPALFVAIYSDPWAFKQLWLFWVAPILGALLAGFFYSWLGDDMVPPAEPVVGEDAQTTVVEVGEE